MWGHIELGEWAIGGRLGWFRGSFCLLRLRLMDRENECPGIVTVFEVGAFGFVCEVWYGEPWKEMS